MLPGKLPPHGAFISWASPSTTAASWKTSIASRILRTASSTWPWNSAARPHIWRTSCDTDPSRVVRGVILDLCPGQETTSLLLSPEGWLIGLVDIEDAENGKLAEPPWCFVKTQFGTLEGHVAVVEMFAALKAEFFPGLEVSDEGGYWENRDLKELAKSGNSCSPPSRCSARAWRSSG